MPFSSSCSVGFPLCCSGENRLSNSSQSSGIGSLRGLRRNSRCRLVNSELGGVTTSSNEGMDFAGTKIAANRLGSENAGDSKTVCAAIWLRNTRRPITSPPPTPTASWLALMVSALSLHNQITVVPSKHHQVRIDGVPHKPSCPELTASVVNDRDEITERHPLLLVAGFHDMILLCSEPGVSIRN